MFHRHKWQRLSVKVIPPWPTSIFMAATINDINIMEKAIHGYEIITLSCKKCGDEKVLERLGRTSKGQECT